MHTLTFSSKRASDNKNSNSEFLENHNHQLDLTQKQSYEFITMVRSTNTNSESKATEYIATSGAMNRKNIIPEDTKKIKKSKKSEYYKFIYC